MGPIHYVVQAMLSLAVAQCPLPGDINENGRSDGADIAPFVSVLSGLDLSPSHRIAADSNHDGIVNADDVPGFVQSILLAGTVTDPSAPVAVGQVVYASIGVPKPFALSALSRGGPISYSVDSQPAYGTVTGTPPDLVYAPAAGYIGADSLTFRVADGARCSIPATIRFNVQSPAAYSLPVGVPAPGFGIVQTVAGVYGSDAYFTHWVDPTSPLATDLLNPNGTPLLPRLTIPGNVPAGSVVVIAAGVFNGSLDITAAGTAALPVFYRGLNPASRPLIKGPLTLSGAAGYVILENIAADRDYLSAGMSIVGPAHHVCVRNCEVTDAQSGIVISGNATNIVVLNTTIHDCGDLAAATQIDHNGITVGPAADVWLLDNLVHHVVGAGIVLDPGLDAPNTAIQRVYASRNVVHHSRQWGLLVRQSQKALCSQNVVFSVIDTAWAPSTGMAYQSGPEKTWFVDNRIFDCAYGVAAAANTVASPGPDQYVVGNLIHDIHKKSGAPFDPQSPTSESAIMLAGGTNRYIVGNTVHSCDAGIYCPDGGLYQVYNNIVENITQAGAYHVWLLDPSGATAWTLADNVFWQEAGGAERLKFRSTVYDIAGIQSGLNTHATMNQNIDPMFAAAAQGDFHLRAGSPGVDSGIAHVYPYIYQTTFGVSIKYDMEGAPRPVDGDGNGSISWDIGALEKH